MGIKRDEEEDRMGKEAEKEKQDAATATAAKKKEEPPKPVDPFTQGMTGEEGIPRLCHCQAAPGSGLTPPQGRPASRIAEHEHPLLAGRWCGSRGCGHAAIPENLPVHVHGNPRLSFAEDSCVGCCSPLTQRALVLKRMLP